MNYHWKPDDWTIPLNLTVGKTAMAGTTPVKLEVEINYCVEQPDALGPKWMVDFNVTPVVSNVVEEWINAM